MYKIFNSKIEKLNFTDEQDSVKKINDWCEKSTKGKIKNIIEKIQAETLLVLANAIYFKGNWKKEFKENQTTKEDFISEHVKKVDMMKDTRDTSYSETENFQAVDLDYEGDELSLLVILPKNKLKNNHLEEIYSTAVNNLRFEENAYICLPKFKMETKYELSDTFADLGSKLLFDDNANFSGIIHGEKVKISSILHKAFVEVNEKGTEAAAVTAIAMIKCCSFRRTQPVVFNANHPFLFFIHNRKTRTILFSGEFRG